jgi:hypothetical protein
MDAGPDPAGVGAGLIPEGLIAGVVEKEPAEAALIRRVRQARGGGLDAWAVVAVAGLHADTVIV